MGKRVKYKKRVLAWASVIVLVLLLGVLAVINRYKMKADVVPMTPTGTIGAYSDKYDWNVNDTFDIRVIVKGGGQAYTSFSSDVRIPSQLQPIAITLNPAIPGWSPGLQPSLTNLSFEGGIKGSTTADTLVYTVTVKATGTGTNLLFDFYQNKHIYELVNRIDNGDIFKDVDTTVGKYNIAYQQVKVSSVTTSKANGAYSTGTAIPFSVTFGSPVKVTGTPYIQTNAAAGARANYTSGSGTSTLVFSYSIMAGDKAAALALNPATINLNAGTILDVASSQAVNLALTGISAFSIVIDTAKPTVTLDTSLTNIHTFVNYTYKATVGDDDTTPTITWTNPSGSPLAIGTKTGTTGAITVQAKATSGVTNNTSVLRLTVTDDAGNSSTQDLNLKIFSPGDIPNPNTNVADGIVNFDDFTLLFNNWTSPAKPIPDIKLSDMNGDGIVNILDMTVLLYYYN